MKSYSDDTLSRDQVENIMERYKTNFILLSVVTSVVCGVIASIIVTALFANVT